MSKNASLEIQDFEYGDTPPLYALKSAILYYKHGIIERLETIFEVFFAKGWKGATTKNKNDLSCLDMLSSFTDCSLLTELFKTNGYCLDEGRFIIRVSLYVAHHTFNVDSSVIERNATTASTFYTWIGRDLEILE